MAAQRNFLEVPNFAYGLSRSSSNLAAVQETFGGGERASSYQSLVKCPPPPPPPPPPIMNGPSPAPSTITINNYFINAKELNIDQRVKMTATVNEKSNFLDMIK